MFKSATFEIDVFCIAQLHSSSGTSQPPLIVELVVVWAVNLWAQLIGLRQIHACLQGNMSFLAGTHPCSMAECHALDGDIPDGTFCTSDEFYQCFQYRHNSFSDGLIRSRHIIELMFADVVIPFAGFVQQFFCVGQIEGRRMARIGSHRRRPRVFELNLCLGIVEPHGDRIAVHTKRGDA